MCIRDRSTNGDTFLGGEDFDKRIIDHLVEIFQKEQGMDLRKDPLALQRLKESAEKAKIELSTSQQTDLNLPYITADQNGPKHLNVKLTRSKLESLVEDLVERTIAPCRTALKDAGLGAGGTHEVILAGGQTRMPMVRAKARGFFGKGTSKNGKPRAIFGGFKGSPTQRAVSPGQVRMELARSDGAANLWMGHNHPSGTPDLSNADRNLSGAFEKILEGSNVRYHGLAAVARQGANVAWTSSADSSGPATAEPPATFRVPMVEREIPESSPSATVSSPTSAKSLVAPIREDPQGIPLSPIPFVRRRPAT